MKPLGPGDYRRLLSEELAGDDFDSMFVCENPHLLGKCAKTLLPSPDRQVQADVTCNETLQSLDKCLYNDVLPTVLVA